MVSWLLHRPAEHDEGLVRMFMVRQPASPENKIIRKCGMYVDKKSNNHTRPYVLPGSGRFLSGNALKEGCLASIRTLNEILPQVDAPLATLPGLSACHS